MKQKNKEKLSAIMFNVAIYLAVLLVIYLAAAFTTWAINPLEWTKEGRAIAAVFGNSVAFFILFIHNVVSNDSDNDEII